MALLNIAPTKSGLLSLRRQLAVAEEGYDLLEQKRQILVFELMSRLKRARALEQQVGGMLIPAFAALREATLGVGAQGVDQAALAISSDPQVEVGASYLMGLRIPRITAHVAVPGVQFGVGGTSADCDIAMQRFTAILPLVAELAEIQNAVLRLSAELRRTQRRCNALSKFFIPNYRQTITYVTATLEERERESFVIIRMIRDRLAAAPATSL